MWRRAKFCSDERGTTAVEFAMVVSVLLALTLGAINMSLVLFAQSALHFAVDDAARCMSVKTACNNTTTVTVNGVTTTTSTPANDKTITYAKASYQGPNIAISFTPTAGGATPGACNKVTGSGTFDLNAVVGDFPITLNAQACYPVSS